MSPTPKQIGMFIIGTVFSVFTFFNVSTGPVDEGVILQLWELIALLFGFTASAGAVVMYLVDRKGN